MSSYGGYAGARYGSGASRGGAGGTGKAPSGWSAAGTSRSYLADASAHPSFEQVAKSRQDRQDAVADRGGGGGGGGGGAYLPFMVENVYIQPVKNNQPGYVRGRVHVNEPAPWLK
mmetsp:Transcript_102350/g.256463  ORF Transcript_102350/g.256463 Transcript_102350/m.256463 type:complete len:115 (+) Transcript_102350:66-410(+)